VAYSPDGKTLASASDDKTIRLWGVATGKQRATLQGHAGPVHSVAYSPDSKTLASASDDMTIRLWEVVTGMERATLLGHTKEVMSVAYSPDGKTWLRRAMTRRSAVGRAAHQESRVSQINDPGSRRPGWPVDHLAGGDAERAYQAIGTLVGVNDQAILLVKRRLRPASEPNVQQITRWIAALDSDQFAVRQQATEELENLGNRSHRRCERSWQNDHHWRLANGLSSY